MSEADVVKIHRASGYEGEDGLWIQTLNNADEVAADLLVAAYNHEPCEVLDEISARFASLPAVDPLIIEEE